MSNLMKSSAPCARAIAMTPAGSPVHQRNDAIESMRDDPDHLVRHGQLCTKRSIGYNNEWIEPRARLTRPLRRVGRFEPVSWDDALAAIADRLKRISPDPGLRAILNRTLSLPKTSFGMTERVVSGIWFSISPFSKPDRTNRGFGVSGVR
jgi:anaerobic selenocysteine-containing dehydrogenase